MPGAKTVSQYQIEEFMKKAEQEVPDSPKIPSEAVRLLRARLILVKQVIRSRRGKAEKYWLCRCDCGKERLVSESSLKREKSKSCGCLRRDLKQKTSKYLPVKFRREYFSYKNAKSRCYREDNNSYESYGGRGIRMSRSWLNSFENFLNDMGECPAGYELDRIDVDGDYKASNCRWVTRRENCRNKRCSISVTYNGLTLHLKEWADRTGIAYTTLYARLKRHNWPTEKLLTTPIGIQ